MIKLYRAASVRCTNNIFVLVIQITSQGLLTFTGRVINLRIDLNPRKILLLCSFDSVSFDCFVSLLLEGEPMCFRPTEIVETKLVCPECGKAVMSVGGRLPTTCPFCDKDVSELARSLMQSPESQSSLLGGKLAPPKAPGAIEDLPTPKAPGAPKPPSVPKAPL